MLLSGGNIPVGNIIKHGTLRLDGNTDSNLCIIQSQVYNVRPNILTIYQSVSFNSWNLEWISNSPSCCWSNVLVYTSIGQVLSFKISTKNNDFKNSHLVKILVYFTNSFIDLYYGKINRCSRNSTGKWYSKLFFYLENFKLIWHNYTLNRILGVYNQAIHFTKNVDNIYYWNKGTQLCNNLYSSTIK